METTITSELTTTMQNLSQTFTHFSAANFNKIPFEGSWTAGQVTEHIFKSVDGIPKLLTGASLPTHRDPGQNIPQLRAMFLDFTTKMKSPAFILPSAEPKNYDTLTASVADRLAAITDASKTIDTNLTIAGFEFTGSGPMTRIELLNFISVHTQRHIHQLQEIAKHV